MSAITQTEPLVTVNILSYNRKDDLRVTLTKVFEQDYKNIEVIVVDNASADGTVEMVKREFPTVQLIELKINVGIAGWNEGFKAAKGEFVLVLDDNAYPKNDAIGLCVDELSKSKNNSAACIAMSIHHPQSMKRWSSMWQSEEGTKTIEYPVFVGCAAMFSIAHFDTHEIMPARYFLYQHELPVSADIYRHNRSILFNPRIIAYHVFSNDTQYSVFRDRLIFQNNLFFILEDLPYWLQIPYLLQIIVFYGVRSARRSWFLLFMESLNRNVRSFRKKKPIPFRYFLELRRLHLFNYSLLSKITFRLKQL